jgi:GntR family transcriptional regulator/MocR family aminotransferase
VAATEQIAFAGLLRSGAFERHVRRMRARYRSRRDRLVAMLAASAPAVEPVGISAGLRVLLELPRDGESGAELARRGRERSIELFPVAPCYHDGRAIRDGVIVGYAALPEHAFDAGLTALGDLLER